MKRVSTAGFALIETLIAFVLVVSVVGVAYTVSTQSLGRQTDLSARLELGRLGRALLTEYAVTYPQLETKGTYRNTWAWDITKSKRTSEDLSDLGLEIDYFDLSLRIWRLDQPDLIGESQTVMSLLRK